MKNLYKIEDELYIISNTENISENCWIITEGRLVQVSYLLSNEVAKGNKVILTTNKLLIKDGVQAIDDDFLEWFVKNPSCERVEVYEVGGKLFAEPIIPKEESRQETLEEAAKIIIPELKHIINDVSTARELWIKGAKWQAERMYSEEEVVNILIKAYEDIGKRKIPNQVVLASWFKQFKKK